MVVAVFEVEMWREKVERKVGCFKRYETEGKQVSQRL